MGFESELAFQETLALKILPELKKRKDELDSNVKLLERQLAQLMNNQTVMEAEVLRVGNEVLNSYKITPHSNIQSLLNHIPEFAKLRATSSVGITIDKLTQAETNIGLFKADDTLSDSLLQVKSQIGEFTRERERVGQIDVISLYDQALGVLTKQVRPTTQCPVCGTEWERGKLVEHIQKELSLLTQVKTVKETIEKAVASLKTSVKVEFDSVKRLVLKYDEVQKIILDVAYEKIKEYQEALREIESSWLSKPLTDDTATLITKELVEQVTTEKEEILKKISAEKQKFSLLRKT